MTESDEDEDYSLLLAQTDKNEIQGILKTLNAKLEDLNTCNDLILKHGFALQQSLSEIENLETVPDAVTKIQNVNEKATLFRMTSNAVINACRDYLQLAQTQGLKWMKMIQHEHEQRLHLEEMVEQLAKQHSLLERAAKGASAISPGIHSDGDEFYDTEEETGSDFVLTIPPKGQVQSVCVTNQCEDNESDSECKASSASESPTHSTNAEKDNKSLVPVKNRRLTVPEKPNYSLNLWSIMKNCIGKELTKIPMPVNFSEPLSTLQRLTEEYEYSDLLDKAAQCSDSCEQMAYVAAYTVSAYATTSNRTGKPFNPLLGETYECDRTDDYGWRCLSEQVSHHPPMLAQHCEGRGWICWQEFTMSSKFRGKYLQIIPLGIAHLLFPASGNHYTWRKVTTFVHNIIVGKLWVDHSGEMEIVNHHTEDKCHLRFIPYSYFSWEVPRQVTGVVTDHEGNAKFVLQGTWDNKMESARVLNSHGSVKGKPLLETSTPKTIWRRQFPGPEYEKMYNFTVLACQLNEPEEGVAPTDSRVRPDQRLMEDGAWDEANRIKVQLEEKQRQVHRKKEEAEEAATEELPYQGYEPIWFAKETDEITGNPVHKFKGEYWKCKENQDWSRCPDIYL
ncbi:Oxysterol-binding protein 2 [Araneus ventricosus]|uniref:Oxysterol-binding protein 2 n=1 Tax=Araneus ventricosus TaxID=182803 RepID=A0A4Y2GHJ3_ARAVE|nr:Oxysterol-binding protein 2 [Araneus ventricosus]